MAGDSQQRMSLKGEFLFAMPALHDPHFFRSVVCVCEHTPDGALGLVVNRLYPSLTGADIFAELNIACQEGTGTIPVYTGGPVHVGEVFVLHGPPFDWAGCLPIRPWLALSNTRDVLEAIAMGHGPAAYLIVLGCSGWGGGQLEAELRENSWITAPADETIMFQVPVEERWQQGLTAMNIDPALLSNTIGNA